MGYKQYYRFGDIGKLTAAQVDSNFDGLYRNGPKPNMLFNPTGAYGTLGWAGTTADSTSGTDGPVFGGRQSAPGEGTYFINIAAISAANYAGSNPMPCQASNSYTLQGEIYASGVSAGIAWFRMVFLDSSKNVITTSANLLAVNGAGWTWVSQTFVTPSNAAYFYVQYAVEPNGSTAPVVSANGVAWRRLKVEYGQFPSPWSDEETINQLRRFPGKFNAYNSPNILPNSTGELGNQLWNATNFAAVSADANGQGTYFLNGAAISGVVYDQAATIPMGAGTNVSISGEMYSSGVSAGYLQFGIDFLNSSGSIISTFAVTAVNGLNWSQYSGSAVTPTGTVSIRIYKIATNNPTISAGGAGFRRLKVERGTMPSLYSQEATLALVGNLINYVNYGGNPNRIVNGSMRVAQRATQALAANSLGYGAVDQFVGGSGSTGRVTLSQDSITYGGVTYPSYKNLIVTAADVSAAGTAFHGLLHRAEAVNVFDISGDYSSLSFIALSNVSGTFYASLRDTNSAYSILKRFTLVAGVATLVTFPALPKVPFTVTSSTNVGLLLTIGAVTGTTYQNATVDSWIAGNYVTGTDATNWANTAGNYLNIAQVKLEKGTLCTAMPYKSYEQDLIECQRYFQITNPSLRFYSPVTAGVIGNTNVTWTQMRAVPSLVSLTNPTTNNVQSSNLAIISVNSGRFEITAGGSTGDTYSLGAVATLSAEL